MRLFSIALSLITLSSAAYCDTIVNVDFNTTSFADTPPSGTVPISSAGTYSGTAAGPASGGPYFNGLVLGNKDANLSKTFSSYTSGALLASDGSTNTGVTVSLGAVDQYNTDENPAAGSVGALLNDYAFAAHTGTFSINGLASGVLYNLFLYSQNGGYANGNTAFTIGGNNQAVTNVVASSGSFSSGVNYVEFLGLTADNANQISGTFANAAENQATFNGFQLVQTTPLPNAATGGLVLLSVVLLTRLRSRVGGCV